MAKKFKKKTIAIIGVIAGALLGYQTIDLFGNQMVYGVPQEYYDEKVMFNSRFLTYEGEINGSSVKILLQMIISNNNANIDDNDYIVSVNGTTEEIYDLRRTIKSENKYNISFEYDEKGLIKNIICEEVK